MTTPEKVWTPADFAEAWKWVLMESPHQDAILEVANSWPERKTVWIEWKAISKLNYEFARQMVTRCQEFVDSGTTAARNLCPPDVEVAKARLTLRVKGSPKDIEVAPGAIRDEHIGRLVRVPGRVKRIKFVQQKIQVGAWQCQRCGSITEVPNPELELMQPLECSESQGGCGRGASSTRWKLLTGRPNGSAVDADLLGLISSRLANLQIIDLEEHYEAGQGHEPREICVYLWDDLVGLPSTVNAVFTGVAQIRVRK